MCHKRKRKRAKHNAGSREAGKQKKKKKVFF